QISGDPAELRPQRLFAFELRRWEAQLGPSARISAGCLRWQELPRFSADAEMIRRRPIEQCHCSLCAGKPPLPARLMAGLAILKHSYDLSDEALCDRWVENPYFQYFCGEEFSQHALVFDRSSLTRWRQRMGQEKLKALLQESLAVATRTDAMK